MYMNAVYYAVISNVNAKMQADSQTSFKWPSVKGSPSIRGHHSISQISLHMVNVNLTSGHPLCEADAVTVWTS